MGSPVEVGVASTGQGEAGVVLTCPAGFAVCSGACVSLQSDLENCGACANTCAAGEVCRSGRCTVTCQATLTDCGGACVDLQSAPLHCGACDEQCSTGAVCQSGVCREICGPGFTNCGGACVSLQNDGQNCGSCGHACTEWQSCMDGSCGVDGGAASNVLDCNDLKPCSAGYVCASHYCYPGSGQACGVTGGDCPASEFCHRGACISSAFKLEPGQIIPGSVGKCVPFSLSDGRTVCLQSVPVALPEEDEFPLAVAHVALPSSVDHRAEYLSGCIAVHDQGACGWCVAHATTGAMEALQCRNSRQQQPVSEPHLWWAGKGDVLDCAGGWYIGDALYTAANNWILPSSLWSYSASGASRTASMPAESVLYQGGIFSVQDVVPRLYDITSIKQVLADGGNVVLGLAVTQSWGDGATTPIGLLPNDPVRGSHAVLAIGYDDADPGTILLLNSWGTWWGDGGYRRVTYDYVSRYEEGGIGVTSLKPTCAGNCGDRVCGDDGCGRLCGVCASGGACNESGLCQPASCTAPVELSIAHHEMRASTAGGTSHSDGSCGATPAVPDHVYHFTLSQPKVLVAEAVGLANPRTGLVSSGGHGNFTYVSPFEPIIYLQTSCGNSASELGCASRVLTQARPTAHLRMNLGPGEYFLVVDGYNRSGDYVLTVDFQCAPECTGFACGPDGCGGSCGTCTGSQEECRDHQCVCLPACVGKACGPDGCGGVCGNCSRPFACVQGECACMPDCMGSMCGEDGCGGTCGLCSQTQEQCWSHICHCVPNCTGKACGPDGCGGSCGGCPLGATCTTGGTCSCAPACDGKQCGDDGCGGSCGGCAADQDCVRGQCVCIPNCSGAACGVNNCGGTCGTCPLGQNCATQQCVCQPNCAGRQCGDDGCGGSCGGCTSSLVCNNDTGTCVQSCQPSCVAKSCGDDACGGTCGTCGPGFTCTDHRCACVPQCTGKQCGPDGCGGTCGNCGTGLTCVGGQCVCVPNCTGKQCGDDGCGGSCGVCSQPLSCVGQQCVCVASCVGKQCGDDGCGGSCGSCSGAQDACSNGACACVGQCAGKQCGDDGCGGSCGACTGSQQVCNRGACICVPNCAGKQCGPDGCNGSCGSCTLSISKTGSGGGTVTSSPAGLACGSSCTATFATGTVVTLSATPDAGSVFTGWSGACTGTGSCAFTIGAPMSISANFGAGCWINSTYYASGTANPSNPCQSCQPGTSTTSWSNVPTGPPVAGKWDACATDTVYDVTRNKTWMKTPLAGVTPADAAANCSSRGSGWRLPTVDEGRTRFAGCAAIQPGGICGWTDPACLINYGYDPTTYCGTSANCTCSYLGGPGEGGLYWDPGVWNGSGVDEWTSSIGCTAQYFYPNYQCTVGFISGSVFARARTDQYNARCIKDGR